MRESPKSSNGESDRNDVKKGGLSRRDVLRGISTVGIGLASGILASEGTQRLPEFRAWYQERARRNRYEKWEGLSAEEREERIDKDVSRARDFLRSPEGKRILEAGTDDEIFGMMLAMPAFLREHIAGTSYDVEKEKWPSVAVGYARTSKAPLALGLQYGREKLKHFYKGNGVFVSPDTVLTNWHVLGPYRGQMHRPSSGPKQDSLSTRLLSTFESTGLDALFVRYDKPATFESDDSRPNVYPLSSDVRESDMVGNLVTVAGIDPDESSSSDGTKLYPSVAIPVTKRLLTFLEQRAGFAAINLLTAEKSFMIIAPPGESIGRRQESASGSRLLDRLRGISDLPHTRMHGMSGSPVLMKGKLAGLIALVGEVESNGVGLDIGLFLGPNSLREAFTSGMTCSEKEVANLIDMQDGVSSYRDTYETYDTYEESYQDIPAKDFPHEGPPEK